MNGTNERSGTDALRMHQRIAATLEAIPYARHLGIRLIDPHESDEVAYHMPFDARRIGNPILPALHGGVVATFMQVVALSETYALLRDELLPKLVDFSIDYLSTAEPRDLFARCEIHRVGKRVAAVGIRCWQRTPNAPVALGRAHVFVAPSASDALCPPP